MRPAPATVATVLAVLAVLAAAGAAQAQAPAPPAPAVTVTIDDEAGKVSVDRAATFVARVKNTTPGSGTQADASNQADVVVTVAGVPEGWTVAVSPASFRLAPQATQDVTLQVSVAADAGARAADLVVTAQLTTSAGGLEPVLGQVPGASQRATASDTLRLARDDSVTREVLEAIGPWIYAVLLLLVAAVLVAVAISLSSRRTLVRLSSETRELTIPPGGRAVFPFHVQGVGRHEDSILLQVSAVQEGWAAFLPVPELVLEPGQSQELTLVVIAPKNAADGARQAVLVSATSAKAPRGAANLEFVASVHGGSPLAAAKRSK